MKKLFTAVLIAGANLCFAQQQQYYDVTAGNGNGLRLWGSDTYKIHMGYGSEYLYGPVTDYSIKMNMSNDAGRGWTWGVVSATPIAALNTLGNMQIAGAFQSKTLKTWAGNNDNLFTNTQLQLSWAGGNGGVSYAHAIKSRHNGGGLAGNSIDFYLWQPGDPTNGEGSLNVMSLNGGKVGIGTNSPSQKLEVNGSVLLNMDNAALGVDAQGAARLGFVKKGGYFPMIASDNGSPIIFAQSNQAGVFTNIASATLTERMRVDANGYVGIGTTSPGAQLDIKSGSTYPFLNLTTNRPYGSSRSWGFITNYVAEGDLVILQSTTNTNTPTVNRVIIDINGNVGIGTPTPSTKLHVNGALKIEPATGGVVGTGTGSRVELSSGGTTSIEENWGINLIGNDASPVKIRNAALLVGYTSSSAGWGTGGNLLVQGNVGIGTTNPGSYKLAVEGKIGAREVNVIATNPWPDYVFEKNYKLPSLEEIKNYIDQNQHLPEVPSAKEVEKNGVNLGEMNAVLLKKIEELTLHIIQQEERIKALEKNQK